MFRHNDMKQELVSNLEIALDRLRTIWDEIGIVADQRKDRTQVTNQNVFILEADGGKCILIFT